MSRIDEALRQAGLKSEEKRPDETPNGLDSLAVFPERESAELHEPGPAASKVVAAPRIDRPPTENRRYFPVTEKLVIHDATGPACVEQYRRIAGTLHQLQEERGLKVLMVASAQVGEGKTLTAANLALTLSESYRRRVLLIDADLRKPRLHEMFGEDQKPGLADVLSGKTSSRDFRKTKISGLWLMPAGTPLRNPADLLGSPRFTKLIEELRAHFDWIVLDSPPVLAVADPCMIARVASGVLLVLDCGRTSRDVAAAAVQRLEAVSAPILGAMLNRVVLDGRGESYLPYYHRSYQAYYPQDENNLLPAELPPAVSE